MANEITVRIGLTVRKGNLNYQNPIKAYSLTMTGTKGPSPSLLTIPSGGKVVSFAELATPGMIVITNIDDSTSEKYVVYGMIDLDDTPDKFTPLGEIGPGEAHVFKLARSLRQEYVGTGTGTTGPSSFFFMKGIGGDVPMQIDAFEK